MRLTVVGAGYLGLTHAACMADLGHEVLALDLDESKIRRAALGEAPFLEPGLQPLLRNARCVPDAGLWRAAGWSFRALGRP